MRKYQNVVNACAVCLQDAQHVYCAPCLRSYIRAIEVRNAVIDAGEKRQGMAIERSGRRSKTPKTAGNSSGHPCCNSAR